MPLLEIIIQAFAENCMIITIIYYTSSYRFNSKVESSISCGAKKEKTKDLKQFAKHHTMTQCLSWRKTYYSQTPVKCSIHLTIQSLHLKRAC